MSSAVSNHPTPIAMLEYYRRHSDDLTNEQVEMFRQLRVKDQLELLYYMNLHGNAAIQVLLEDGDKADGVEIF